MTKIIFEYEDFERQYSIESAWAEKTEEGYRLDNLLFYAKEYALSDIVSVEAIDDENYVTGLITASGHSLVRIVFFEADLVQSTRKKLAEMGCESEVSDLPKLISVDIPSVVSYESVKLFYKTRRKQRNVVV
jgi:Domain of unknown function (DUF4265)